MSRKTFNQNLIAFNLILYFVFVAYFCKRHVTSFIHMSSSNADQLPLLNFLFSKVPVFNISYAKMILIITSIYVVLFMLNILLIKFINRRRKEKYAENLLPKCSHVVVLANSVFTFLWLALCFTLASFGSGSSNAPMPLLIGNAFFAVQFLFNIVIASILLLLGFISDRDYTKNAAAFLYASFVTYFMVLLGYLVIMMALDFYMHAMKY